MSVQFSDGPSIAADALPSLAEKMKSFCVVAILKSANGITVSEFSELTLALMRISIAAADAVPVSGPERKEFVLAGVGLLFDSVADRMIPVLAWPVWILLKPMARTFTLSMASGGIEAILPLLKVVS